MVSIRTPLSRATSTASPRPRPPPQHGRRPSRLPLPSTVLRPLLRPTPVLRPRGARRPANSARQAAPTAIDPCPPPPPRSTAPFRLRLGTVQALRPSHPSARHRIRRQAPEMLGRPPKLEASTTSAPTQAVAPSRVHRLPSWATPPIPPTIRIRSTPPTPIAKVCASELAARPPTYLSAQAGPTASLCRPFLAPVQTPRAVSTWVMAILPPYTAINPQPAMRIALACPRRILSSTSPASRICQPALCAHPRNPELRRVQATRSARWRTSTATRG